MFFCVIAFNGGIRGAHHSLGWNTAVSAHLLAPPMLEEGQVFKEAMGASPTTEAGDSSRAWGENDIFCYCLHLRSIRLLCLHRLPMSDIHKSTLHDEGRALRKYRER